MTSRGCVPCADTPFDRRAAIADCARQGGQLTRTPIAERDLAWHVKAYFLGDIGALASAALRTDGDGPTAPTR